MQLSIEKLSGTDLKLLPPPRFVLNFPNRTIRHVFHKSSWFGGYTRSSDHRWTLSKTNNYNNRTRIAEVDLSGPGPAHPEHLLFYVYLFIYFKKSARLAVSSHRQRRRPMTTIPTRLARTATVSTSSVHQRKRVLDLYREWMRGVR